ARAIAILAVGPLAARCTLPVPATFGSAALMRHRVVLEHFAFEDPHLDADEAVGRIGLGNTVVDVRAQRVQRDAALAVALGAGDVGTAEASTDVDADAAGAHADRRLHGALHRPAERHAGLELLGNALGDEGRIGFRL